MSVPTARGRVLRTGRNPARVVVTWAAVTGALLLLDAALSGFTLPSWWQPPVMALLVGLLAGLAWPLVMRVALPLAFFTFGLGGFLLLGAGVLGISFLVPGVYVANLRTGVLVAVAMAAVSGVVSSVLAIDEDEVFFRRARRRAGGTGGRETLPPGVLFLQIDGLGYETARRAARDGFMPTLAAWLRAEEYVLGSWHTDRSSQTAASQCGILHGSNHDVLGFRWYEKERDHVMQVSHPEDAAEIERRHSDGRGLLAPDGAGRGNLFTGDARHVSLTMSSLAHVVPAGSRRPRPGRDRVGAGYYAYFANPVNALRTLGVCIVEVFREIAGAARERRAGVHPRVSRGGLYPLARAATTVITRDVVVAGLIEDMLAGRPVVYADFLGYDEVAHHSGPERIDGLQALRGIDQQVGRLARAAELAPRPYHLVLLSDHGQTQGEPFAGRFGETIESLVGRLCGDGTPLVRRTRGRTRPVTGPRDSRRQAESWQVASVLAEAASSGGPIARRLRERVERGGTAEHRPRTPSGRPGTVARVAPGVVCVVSGHSAMVSFAEIPGRVPLEVIEREWPELLPGLVDHPGVGFVLVRSAEFGPVALGRDGVRRLGSDEVFGVDPLAAYGRHAAALLARESSFPHCPDLVINSRYDAETDEASPFEPHVGSHGGLGGAQTRALLAYPRSFAVPGPIVGAEQLHGVLRGWLTDLGHTPPTGEAATAGPDSLTARGKRGATAAV